MCVRCSVRKIPRLYGVTAWCGSQSQQGSSHIGYDASKESKWGVSLNNRVAALNRFIFRVMDKCLPFFKTLKKSFEWTDECQKAFEELKAYLASSPLLSPSKLGEELSLYLAMSPIVVSSAFIREEDHIQLLVYYTSQMLWGAKGRYP